MHEVNINLPDEAYLMAQKRAQQEGFVSIEGFLSDVFLFLVNTITSEPDNYDHLFTPNVLASIDKGAQEIIDGKSMTRSEVDAHLATKRAEWLANHQS